VGGIGVREVPEYDQEEFGTLPQNFTHGTPPAVTSVSHVHSPASPARAIFSLDRLPLPGRRSRRMEDVLPPPDPSQRPFDGLVNYLPSGISDKSLLKHVILVTTITRPFLVPVASPSIARSTSSRRNSPLMRRSLYLLSTPGSTESLNTVLSDSPASQGSPTTRAHLVHVLPSRPRSFVANRLVDSIETFLLSFSSPPTLGVKNGGGIEPANPYLIESSTFSQPIGTPPSLKINWTMADLLLSNCLDDQPTPRVWFSGASDIIVAALPQSKSKQSLVKRPIGRSQPPSTASSSRTPSPTTATSPSYINTPPTTPSDSGEEEAWYRRRVVLAKEAWNQTPWRWSRKFWKRPPTVTTIAR
jgi:hypothetical protein